MARAYFRLFYDQYLPLMTRLSFEEAGRLFVGTLRYLKEEIEPDLPGAESIVWPLLKEDIDRDKRAYISKCMANAENGRKGGLKKQENLANANERQPEVAKPTQAKEAKESNQAKKSNQAYQAHQAKKAAAVEAVDSEKFRVENDMARMQRLLRIMRCEEEP